MGLGGRLQWGVVGSFDELKKLWKLMQGTIYNFMGFEPYRH